MAEPTYRDFDFSFKSHPLSADIVTVTDGNAIKTSLKNLVRLIRYDKPFNPEISSPLYDALFEPMDPGTASLMKTGLTFYIEDYEPRIENIKIVVTPVPKENKYCKEDQQQGNSPIIPAGREAEVNGERELLGYYGT